MSDSDPRQRADASELSRATQSRAAALAAEVALRDRELTLLRDALEVERAQARATRTLADENLQEAEHAAQVQRQLEQALDEVRSAYSDLRVQHDRVAFELEAAQTRALERAERAEAARAAAAAARRQVEQERDRAVALAAQAEQVGEERENTLRAALERVAAELAAARQRAEQERHDAASAAAEALTALSAAEYRRRTRYEHTIGELRATHAAALERAARAEQSLLEVLAEVRASLVDREGELASSHRHVAALESHLERAACEHQAMRATLAERESELTAQRDACAVAVQEAEQHRASAAARWAEQHRLLAEAQARELDASTVAARSRSSASNRHSPGATIWSRPWRPGSRSRYESTRRTS
jgi:hypothetical protein